MTTTQCIWWPAVIIIISGDFWSLLCLWAGDALSSAVSVILPQRKQAESLLEETTREHMTAALSQLPFPWCVLPPPPHIQQCSAGYPPAVMVEPGLVQVKRRSKGEQKKNEGEMWRSTANKEMLGVCTVNSGSSCSAVTAPAEVRNIWASSVIFTPSALQQQQRETRGGLVLVYRDSCSKAGCHGGAVALDSSPLAAPCADADLVRHRVQRKHSWCPQPRWSEEFGGRNWAKRASRQSAQKNHYAFTEPLKHYMRPPPTLKDVLEQQSWFWCSVLQCGDGKATTCATSQRSYRALQK